MNKQARSPEYVSLYIDDLLRNKNKDTSEQEMEQRMDKVMSLFRLVTQAGVCPAG